MCFCLVLAEIKHFNIKFEGFVNNSPQVVHIHDEAGDMSDEESGGNGSPMTKSGSDENTDSPVHHSREEGMQMAG